MRRHPGFLILLGAALFPPVSLSVDAAETPAANLPTVPAASALPVAATEPAADSKDEPAKPGEGAEVVRLDRFPKK